MAAYRRLVVGDRPVVVSFPEWLLHDDAVDLAYRRLCRESAGRCLSYADASQVVLLVPRGALDADEALCWALHTLQDEITVWRLATADGSRAAGASGSGLSNRAYVVRWSRETGRAPRGRGAGWRVA